jgi:hypothetical protein
VVIGSPVVVLRALLLLHPLLAGALFLQLPLPPLWLIIIIDIICTI